MSLLKRLTKTARDWSREDQYWAELQANRDPLFTPDPKGLKLYVLVRSDILPPLNQGVQAAHAIVELFNHRRRDAILRVGNWANLDKWATKDKTLVLLASKDPEADAKFVNMTRKLNFALFREPDLGDIVTAAAIEPVTRELGEEIFGRMALAK